MPDVKMDKAGRMLEQHQLTQLSTQSRTIHFDACQTVSPWSQVNVTNRKRDLATTIITSRGMYQSKTRPAARDTYEEQSKDFFTIKHKQLIDTQKDRATPTLEENRLRKTRLILTTMKLKSRITQREHIIEPRELSTNY